MADSNPLLRKMSQRANALWGRGGRRAGYAILLGVSLAAGAVVSATIEVPAASSQASDCIPAVTTVCPTVPTVSLPTTSASVPLPTTSVSLPVTTTTGSTTTSPTTTSSASSSPATTTTDLADSSDPQSAGAPFVYDVRSTVRRSGSRRWIVLRISLSQPASINALLARGAATTARRRAAGRQGANTFRLTVPRSARAGRYRLTVTLATADIRRTVRRSLLLPKAGS
jgi:hypothetical protein